jgi:hypothetical protein
MDYKNNQDSNKKRCLRRIITRLRRDLGEKSVENKKGGVKHPLCLLLIEIILLGVLPPQKSKK